MPTVIITDTPIIYDLIEWTYTSPTSQQNFINDFITAMETMSDQHFLQILANLKNKNLLRVLIQAIKKSQDKTNNLKSLDIFGSAVTHFSQNAILTLMSCMEDDILLEELRINMEHIIKRQFTAVISAIFQRFPNSNTNDVLSTLDNTIFSTANLFFAAEQLSDRTLSNIICSLDPVVLDAGQGYSNVDIEHKDQVNVSLLIKIAERQFEFNEALQKLLPLINKEKLNTWLRGTNTNLNITNFHKLAKLLNTRLLITPALVALLRKLTFKTFEVIFTVDVKATRYSLINDLSDRPKELYEPLKIRFKKIAYLEVINNINPPPRILAGIVNVKRYVLAYIFGLPIDEQQLILEGTLNGENRRLHEFFSIPRIMATNTSLNRGSFLKMKQRLELIADIKKKNLLAMNPDDIFKLVDWDFTQASSHAEFIEKLITAMGTLPESGFLQIFARLKSENRQDILIQAPAFSNIFGLVIQNYSEDTIETLMNSMGEATFSPENLLLTAEYLSEELFLRFLSKTPKEDLNTWLRKKDTASSPISFYRLAQYLNTSMYVELLLKMNFQTFVAALTTAAKSGGFFIKNKPTEEVNEFRELLKMRFKKIAYLEIINGNQLPPRTIAGVINIQHYAIGYIFQLPINKQQDILENAVNDTNHKLHQFFNISTWTFKRNPNVKSLLRTRLEAIKGTKESGVEENRFSVNLLAEIKRFIAAKNANPYNFQLSLLPGTREILLNNPSLLETPVFRNPLGMHFEEFEALTLLPIKQDQPQITNESTQQSSLTAPLLSKPQKKINHSAHTNSITFFTASVGPTYPTIKNKKITNRNHSIEMDDLTFRNGHRLHQNKTR